jgi:hypothetical protein
MAEVRPAALRFVVFRQRHASITSTLRNRPARTLPTDQYCVYAGRSSDKGGIEFDAFVADSVADAVATFRTFATEARGAGVDRAWALGVGHARLTR